MLAVGLTGGIGSGKSAVADRLVAKGAVLIDADQIAREVVEPGQPVLAALVERFGETILAPDGTLDRAAVAAITFSDPEALAALNAITHPAIGIEMITRRDSYEGTDTIVVLAIPLLRDLHRETVRLSVVVVVDCPTEIALERLVNQRHMPAADAQARIGAQISREERIQGADYVLDNAGSVDQLDVAVEQLWAFLETKLAEVPKPL